MADAAKAVTILHNVWLVMRILLYLMNNFWVYLQLYLQCVSTQMSRVYKGKTEILLDCKM